MLKMHKALILEEDQQTRQYLQKTLSKLYDIRFWPENGKDIFEELKTRHYDVILIDLHLKSAEAFDLLRWIYSTIPFSPVIMSSNTEKAELIVKAVKLGAYNFIVKPYSEERMKLVIKQALETRSLKNEIDYLRGEQDFIYDFNQIIAFSPSMKEIIKTLQKFSRTDSTMLMTGETGTGKSFFSGSLHFNSHRRNKPFIKINCANIPETLLESELFGHEKGSFTGAEKLRIGRFEQAHGGTLFLDEIGEISLSIQAKLLRLLEEKSFERVGGNKTIHSDVRVIAATNRDLEKQIIEKKFREDLFYRINVLTVKLPPLRKRRECIEPLAYAMLDKVCKSLKKRVTGFDPAVMNIIKNYKWPGNIRQLANTIERAVILEDSQLISKENLSILNANVSDPDPDENGTEPLETHEKDHIVKVLEDTLWIQKDAAKKLGISPRTLNYKIKKFNITHPRWRKNK